jgi:hypothetical protein
LASQGAETKYTLTKPQYVRPPNLSKGEAEVVYMCLESDGMKPKTFDELMVEANQRKLQAHFKRHESTTLEESLKYWLALFKKNGWVRAIDD